MPGSFLVLTHMSTDLLGDAELDSVRRAARVFDNASAQLQFRTRPEIMKFFGDWHLVDPGLVPKHEWRPDRAPSAPGEALLALDIAWAGVARKR